LMGGEDLGEVVGVQRACVDCGFRWGVARSFVFLIEWAAGFATTIRKRSGDLVRRNIRGEGGGRGGGWGKECNELTESVDEFLMVLLRDQ
jgi:hypothetical protein